MIFNLMSQFKCKWYTWCVYQAFLFAKQKDYDNWLRWWCLRNKYTQQLSDKEIHCYYEYKKEYFWDTRTNLLNQTNGKPKIATNIQLKK